MDIRKELTKGSSALLALSVLEKGDMYGYQIIKELEQQSEFFFTLKEGTLYPILHAFEQEGMLVSYWLDDGGKRKRKYYRISDRGIKLLSKTKEEWREYSKAMNKIVTGGSINATR